MDNDKIVMGFLYAVLLVLMVMCIMFCYTAFVRGSYFLSLVFGVCSFYYADKCDFILPKIKAKN